LGQSVDAAYFNALLCFLFCCFVLYFIFLCYGWCRCVAEIREPFVCWWLNILMFNVGIPFSMISSAITVVSNVVICVLF